MTGTRIGGRMQRTCAWAAKAIFLLAGMAWSAVAQEPPAPRTNEAAPVVLTLKRAIELALQNSKDIQVAKIQARVADHAAQITKAQFLPNLYAGSGAGYSNGI